MSFLDYYKGRLWPRYLSIKLSIILAYSGVLAIFFEFRILISYGSSGHFSDCCCIMRTVFKL